jgi:predicted transcriptional regulator
MTTKKRMSGSIEGGRMLEYDGLFVAAVEEGRATARRGDLLEHHEVVERVEQILRS